MDDRMNRLRAALSKIKREIRWKVMEKPTPHSFCNISSDSIAKQHRIGIRPDKDEYQRMLDTLHEYCHAFLCEQVDTIFSELSYSVGRLSDEDRWWLRECACAASDWFCDEEVNRRFPDGISSQPRRIAFSSQEDFFLKDNVLSLPVLALVAAEEERYSGVIPLVPTTMAPLVGVFLSVNPSKPSAQALTNLVNGLLSHVRPGVTFKPSYPIDPDEYE